jgi:hypothetical protein
MNICMNKIKFKLTFHQDKCFLKDKNKCLKKLIRKKPKSLKKISSPMRRNFKE